MFDLLALFIFSLVTYNACRTLHRILNTFKTYSTVPFTELSSLPTQSHRMHTSSAPSTLHVKGHHIAAQELLVGQGQSRGQYSAVVPGRCPPCGPLASRRAVGRERHGFQGRNLHRWGSAETVVMERTGY